MKGVGRGRLEMKNEGKVQSACRSALCCFPSAAALIRSS